jgi:5-methylcytosine-specific restriction protein B
LQLQTRKKVIPENITKEHLLKAIEEIDKEGIRKGRQSSTYDLIYNGKPYPPKLVLSIANKFPNGEELDHNSFWGGQDTPSFKKLESMGFAIEKKSKATDRKKEFTSYLEKKGVKGSNQLSSYLRALDLLASVLGRKAKSKLGDHRTIYDFGDFEEIDLLYEYILIEQNTDGIFLGEKPASYYKSKFYSAALKSYSDFLKSRNTIKSNSSINCLDDFTAWLAAKEGISHNYLNDAFGNKTENLKSALIQYEQMYMEDFGSKIFEIQLNNLENKIQEINSNIYSDNEQNSGVFLEYSRKKSNHMPRAIIGKRNYLEFLKSLIEKQLGQQLKFDLAAFLDFFQNTGLSFDPTLIKRFLSSLVTKPFVLLSGLSGSGKTKLAEAFVKWICANEEQYKLVPVGADWTNREPLLGFPNALSKGEYTHPDNGVLKLIIEANKNADRPYFLILDEMNLSHVERYFADFLSTMESSDAEIQLHDSDAIADETKDDFVPKTIKLPKNLFIIGTVNIDETTYMFSPKVLDRANTIEFRVTDEEISSFFDSPKDIDLKLLETEGANMATSFLELSQKSSEKADAELVKDELVAFFRELQKLGAEFGYRTANEAVKLTARLGDFGIDNSEQGTNTKIDVAIMQKLLPKLSGSRSRLVSVLTSLGKLCVTDDKIVTDFFGSKEYPDFTKTEGIKYPISFEKITRMHRNAMANGFASYAEA